MKSQYCLTVFYFYWGYFDFWYDEQEIEGGRRQSKRLQVTHILTTSACFIRTVPDGMQATDRIPSKSEESYDEQI